MAQKIQKECDPETCGCHVDIVNLKASDAKLWGEMSKLSDKQDRVLTRINVLIGGVGLVLLAALINIIKNSGHVIGP